MPTEVYPFTKDQNGVYRPLIPVRLINPLEKGSPSFTVMALLDTGADHCVFPKFIAEQTKHNLKGEGVQSETMQGVAQDKIEVWKHTFKIELLKPDKKTPFWKSKETLVSCLDHDNVFPLLGFSNFMAHFKIIFHYQTKKIIIELTS